MYNTSLEKLTYFYLKMYFVRIIKINFSRNLRKFNNYFAKNPLVE